MTKIDELNLTEQQKQELGWPDVCADCGHFIEWENVCWLSGTMTTATTLACEDIERKEWSDE